MQINAIPQLRIVAGGDKVLNEAIGLANRAQTSLSGEFFALQDPAVRGALADAWQNRGIGGSAVITAHPQSVEQLDGLLGPRTAHAYYAGLEPVRAPREFIHTKTLARDAGNSSDPEAWVSTGSAGQDTRSRWDIAGIFGGTPAKAVHELANSITSRDWQRQRDAISWARESGIYLTDPVANERGLPRAILELVRHEPKELTIAMKSIFDETFAREIAARHARDELPVTVIAKRIDEPSERILREAGVNLLKPASNVPEIHGNAIVAHGLDQAYFGTLWASPRGFGRDAIPNPFAGGGATLPRSQWWDRSRELGVVTNDPAAVRDVREGMELLSPHAHDFRGEVIRVQ